MPQFVMLSKVTTSGGQTLHTHPDRVMAVDQEIEQLGCRVVSQYALLGHYDFLTVVEAPDEGTMVHLSVDLSSRGSMSIETLPAIPMEEFVDALKSTHQIGKGEVQRD